MKAVTHTDRIAAEKGRDEMTMHPDEYLLPETDEIPTCELGRERLSRAAKVQNLRECRDLDELKAWIERNIA